MNEKLKSKMLAEALSRIEKGTLSVEDCTNQFPELRQDLMDAVAVIQHLKNSQRLDLSSEKLRKMKIDMLSRLPDRSAVVTKISSNRFKLQNLKRRFAMTWLIIITTLASLVSGAGVAYASGGALPGEMLYPVKMAIEDFQLAISPPITAIRLNETFAGHRLEEAAALSDEGDFEFIGDLVSGYQNRTETMERLLAKMELTNPEEALKIRTELELKLQEHARMMERILQNDPDNLQLQARLQEMLQISTQTRSRISETLIQTESGAGSSGASNQSAGGDAAGQGGIHQEQNQNQNRVINVEAGLDKNNKLQFHFRSNYPFDGEVFAEVSGNQYGCVVEGTTATCDMTGSPGVGQLKLYSRNTNQLLYSYEYSHNYEYLWLGTKESNGPQFQGGENPEGSGGMQNQGGNGGNQTDSGGLNQSGQN